MQPRLECRAQHAAPLIRQLPTTRRDTDQQNIRIERQPRRDRRDHRNRATEAEYLLDGLAGIHRVEHTDNLLRREADAADGGLRRMHAERTFSEDQVARSQRHDPNLSTTGNRRQAPFGLERTECVGCECPRGIEA